MRDYLPEFRLHDDYATLRATPRDWSRIASVCRATTGVVRVDAVARGAVRAPALLPFSRDIRTRFQYNNFMFMTAGISGGGAGSWEDLVRSSLFDPLEMKRTGFTLAALTVGRGPRARATSSTTSAS